MADAVPAAREPLNFLLATIGSAGDVNPFIGLGRELKRRGHRVTLLTCAYFAESIRRAGLDFAETTTREEYLEMIEHPDLWHPIRAAPFVMQKAIAPLIRRVYGHIMERYEPGRTIVAASTLSVGARVAEDAHGVPTATIHLQPAVVRSIVSPPKLPGMLNGPRVPRWLLGAQFWLADKIVVDRILAPEINGLRKDLNLPAANRFFGDYLHSPQRTIGLWPDWFAPPQSDWPPSMRLAGFPLYDEHDVASLDAELQQFLDAGTPPLAFTPGSAMKQGAPFFAAAAEACRRLGRRGLLLTRHPEQLPPTLPNGVRHVDFAPFTHLLPRCAALVHHGGIGTMSQAFAAGIPHIIMPLAHDQYDNAARVERLGVGTSLPPKRFTADRLAVALQSLLDSPSVKNACREYAAKLTSNTALADAADLLEGLLPRR